MCPLIRGNINDWLTAKLIPNPTVSLNYVGLVPNFDRFISTGDNSQLTIRLAQLIELGGKRRLRTSAASEGHEAAKLRMSSI